MALATITSKGQVTIPKDIRESLKLHSGDKIEILVTKNGEAIIKPVSRKVDEVFCKLYSPGRKAVSVESIKKIIQERMKGKFE